MISTINPESILNIIKNQFFSIIRREKDTFGNINVDISLERQYIQYEESVENTIYIVVYVCISFVLRCWLRRKTIGILNNNKILKIQI